MLPSKLSFGVVAISRLFMLLSVLLLSGCFSAVAPTPPKADIRAFKVRQLTLSNLAYWQMTARVGATGSYGFNAKMLWKQRGDGFFIDIKGPLGSGRLKITGSANEVTLDDGESKFQSRQPEQDLERIYGWTVPITQLRWWAIGIPGKTSKYKVNIDGRGRPIALEQDGWLVTYEQWHENSRPLLPRKIVAKRPDMTIRIVVDEWLVNSPLPAANTRR